MSASYPSSDFDRVPPASVAQAMQFQSAMLADVFGRRGTLNARVQALGRHMKVAGPAYTVEVRPGDNLMFHVALALAKPGDVIIVDGKGDETCALFGELMITQSEAAGHAGLVVDAPCRDTGVVAGKNFPVFAAGRNPCGPTKGLAGTICKPISVAGAPVQPGDLVLGDEDGVVVIPRADVAWVLEGVSKKLIDEQTRLDEIAAGDLVSPWLHGILRSVGLPHL